MTLFAGNGFKDHESLLELFKADDYERTTAKDVDDNSAHLESTDLPNFHGSDEEWLRGSCMLLFSSWYA